MKKFTRIFETEPESFRATTDDKGDRYIEGYAAVFNRKSKILNEFGETFREIINPDAFTEVLEDPNLDVTYNLNHDNDRIMGRTKSGTLTLQVDDKGLKFRVLVPNTTIGNDVYELVSRGDLYENSFAFYVRKDDVERSKDEDGNAIHTIRKVTKLYDVSTVYSGAYAETDVFARDEDEVEEVEKTEEIIETPKPKRNLFKEKLERMVRQTKLLKLKIN